MTSLQGQLAEMFTGNVLATVTGIGAANPGEEATVGMCSAISPHLSEHRAFCEPGFRGTVFGTFSVSGLAKHSQYLPLGHSS